MSTDLSPRRGIAERVTGALWGAIVTAIGALTIAALSGYRIDLELFAIIALGSLGAWLLFSAIAAASRASRRERERAAAVAGPAPVMEDDAEPETPAEPVLQPMPESAPEPELADTKVFETPDTEVIDTEGEPKREA